MSIYDDDGFDEEAAELSEAITGSYTGPGGGQQTGFSFDDGGDSGVNVTLGKSGPRGTSITGNVIRGGTIFGRTQSQLDRQQRLAGMGDYRNSEAYERYKRETGRSLRNPYGNTGLFSGIFGADRVNYNMDPAQAQNILDIGFDRYMNFDQQPEYAQSKGFGKLFGSPEGEMTAQGELRAQVPETTTAESLLSSIIPGAGFLPTPGTTYAPMGSTSYDPQRDPKANQDLRSGPFSLLTDALSKGRDFISDRLNPLPDAPPSRPRAPVQETRRDIIDTRTPAPPQRTVTAEQQKLMDEISQGMDVAGLRPEQRTDFLNDIIGQQIQTTYKIDNNPRLRYTPESRINANTGEIFGDDDRAADYQIAAARLKEMEDFNAAPTYPQSQNFGRRDSDSLPATLSAGDFLLPDSDSLPTTLSAGDFVLPSGEVINTNRSSFSGSILKDIIDGNLFETDFLGGQLKFSPEFDLKRGLTGGNIQFKKRF